MVRRSMVALSALVLAVSACGTTVDTETAAGLPPGVAGVDENGALVDAEGNVVSTDPGPGSGDLGAPGAEEVTAPGGSPAGPPDGAATTSPGAPPSSEPGDEGSTPGAAGSREPVKVGVITQPGLEAVAQSMGLDGVTTGDTRKQVEAVVGWIEDNGGLAGRPIEIYEYEVDFSDGSNTAVQNNACVAMAQDHKVRFVVTVIGGLETLAACLAKYGVGLLANNANLGDATRAKYAATVASPSELAPGRSAALLVDDLWKRGWLTAGSKVGVLAVDGADGRATVSGPLTAALRRHGLSAAATNYINPNTGDGGFSQSSSAVLRFRTAGVDRVIPVMYSPLYFMNTAESQGYRPAYALDSAQGPGALIESLAPANQLKNAAGIGWAPFNDIGRGTKPAPVSQRATLCFNLMEKAQQGSTSALIKTFQALVCDLMFYLYDLARLEPGMPQDILTSGRKKLGDDFVSPATYRVDVTNRTDGVAAYRSLAYVDGCSCFQYVGPVVPTP
jgi:hypothetical protein